MNIKNLSSKSSFLLTHFLNLGKNCFSIYDAEEVLKNSNYEAVKALLKSMVKRGLLLRLKEGLYWIIPYEEDATTYFPNWHLAGKCLAGEAEYYIGY